MILFLGSVFCSLCFLSPNCLFLPFLVFSFLFFWDVTPNPFSFRCLQIFRGALQKEAIRCPQDSFQSEGLGVQEPSCHPQSPRPPPAWTRLVVLGTKPSRAMLCSVSVSGVEVAKSLVPRVSTTVSPSPRVSTN